TQIGTAATIDKIVHLPRAAAAILEIRFVILEVVGIAGHGNLHAPALQQLIQGGKFFVANASIFAACETGMAYDRHDELTSSTIERPLEPRPLTLVHCPLDS